MTKAEKKCVKMLQDYLIPWVKNVSSNAMEKYYLYGIVSKHGMQTSPQKNGWADIE